MLVTGTPSIDVNVASGAFNPATDPLIINYTLSDINAGDVKLQVTDGQGFNVRTIDAEKQKAGSYAFVWDGLCNDGQQAPDGIYTLKVFAGEGMIPTPQNVLRWDSGVPASRPGLSYYPYCPATDAQGNIYVTDGRQDCVLKFDRYGNLLRKWGSTGSGDGQFRNPAGIATDGAGNVYVADTLNSRIEKFDADGRFLQQWGGYGTSNGMLNCPSGIAIDSAGKVYVADTLNHRIQCFNDNGQFLSGWGSYGNGDGQLSAPGSIAVGPEGTLYVADTYNDRIQKFTPSGEFLGAWGNTGDRRLIAPSGISPATGGNLLVVDDGNRRVQEFTSSGSPLNVDYAPDAFTDTSTDSLPFPADIGYVARWKMASDGPESLAFLSDQGCLHVRELIPFTLGDPAAIVATASVMVDRVAPSISIRTPFEGDRYTRNQVVTALWNASDGLSGLYAVTGSAKNGTQIDTSLPGPHDFTVYAIDKAGNAVTAISRYYVYDNSPAVSYNAGPGPTVAPGNTPIPGGNTPTPPPGGPTGAIVEFGGTRINAELATTDDQINRGLMFRPSLPGGSGMLFVFGNSQVHTFTMANMNFPLDIIFIKSDLTVLSIARNAQPGTSGISSGGSCQYVLEVNAGVASGIGPGSKITVTWL